MGSPLTGVVPKEIRGLLYPGETVTTGRGGQWYVDGGTVIGQTGPSYTIGVNDIGKILSQNGRYAVVWHPRDLPGVNGVWLANRGLLNASAVPCADGDPVATWQDQSGNGYNLVQATASARPIAQLSEISGNNAVQFDGTSDGLYIGSGGTVIFRAKAFGYALVACSDANIAGAPAIHVPFMATAGGATGSRLSLFTRNTSSLFVANARRLDAETAGQAAAASSSGWKILTCEALFIDGAVNLRSGGNQLATASMLSSGISENTNSQYVIVGSGFNANFFPGLIAGVITAAPGTRWSAADRSRAERYLGLLVGQNIPLA